MCIRDRWRLPLAAGWLAASPFAELTNLAPTLSRWPLLEIGLLLALIVKAFRTWREAWSGAARSRALTGEADLRTQGPA